MWQESPRDRPIIFVLKGDTATSYPTGQVSATLLLPVIYPALNLYVDCVCAAGSKADVQK